MRGTADWPASFVTADCDAAPEQPELQDEFIALTLPLALLSDRTLLSTFPPENILLGVALLTKNFPSKSRGRQRCAQGGARSEQCLPGLSGLPSYTETGLGGTCPVISAPGR